MILSVKNIIVIQAWGLGLNVYEWMFCNKQLDYRQKKLHQANNAACMHVMGRIIDEVRCIQCIGYRMKCEHFYSQCFNTICWASGKAPGCKTPRFNNPQIFPTDTPVSAGSGPTFDAHRDAGSGFLETKRCPCACLILALRLHVLSWFFFTKFECSMKKVEVRRTGAYRYKKHWM